MTTSAEPLYKSHPVTQEDIDYLASVPRLLVAMDFDGTLANFASQPMEARAYPGGMDALHALAHTKGTEATILSGRNLEQLTVITELPIPTEKSDGTILLVGSHGAEAGHGSPLTLSPEQTALREKFITQAEKLSATEPGTWVEYKPTSIGFHTRTAENKESADATLETLKEWALQQPGAHVTHGKNILEMIVDPRTKGTYLQDTRQDFNADAVLFAGDDTTDETAFTVLNQGTDYAARPDVGIKVGDGDTAAQRGLEAVPDVTNFLQKLAAARAEKQGTF